MNINNENKNKFLIINKILLTGGIMLRFIRLSLLVAFFALLITSVGFAQKPQVYVSGKLARHDVRIFQKDSAYVFNNEYVVAGTLIIEPGTEIYFYPNSRLLDSVGGRIIADGSASANYTAKPKPGATTYDPIAGSDPVINPFAWSGYADLKYFSYLGAVAPSLAAGPSPTIAVTTVGDQTIHSTRYDMLFNVVLDISSRKLRSMASNGKTFDDLGNEIDVNPATQVIIPFEKALMFQASRMFLDPNTDANLNNKAWLRQKVNVSTNTSPNIVNGQIKFYGQPENNISREWGHIVVLPGSRTAFFRNCSFEGFRKDTTVDRLPYFSANTDGLANTDKTLWNNYNNSLRLLSNGSGGVITTFSSRTWLINCQFNRNRSFVRGGALQILQAPGNHPGIMTGTSVLNIYKVLTDVPLTAASLVGYLGEYSLNKNPNIANRDGSASDILNDPLTQTPRIDVLDEALGSFPNSDAFMINSRERSAWDDARVAVYLGRFRNLTFTDNKAQLNNTGPVTFGTPPVTIWKDKTNESANSPQNYGDNAYGGAIYIAGNNTGFAGSVDGTLENASANRKIEIGFGINNSILIGGSIVNFTNPDSFTATGNEANNYQSKNTFGARGGAIYSGAHTSLIVAGNFTSNKAQAIWLQDDAIGTGAALYSNGGAIFTANYATVRLQVVGGSSRESGAIINNPTLFSKNYAAAGGAIYVDGFSSGSNISPVIGGHDQTLLRRDLGFNIVFDNNTALVHGGAIFTKHNMVVQGAGGVASGEIIGYGGKYPVLFNANTAGYSGGAVSIHIPNGQPLVPNQRNVELTRTVFQNNTTGAGVAVKNIPEIRGGAGVYSLNSTIGLIKGVEFSNNTTYNGNGGALTLVHPTNSQRRFFVSDLDVISYDANGVPGSYFSNDGAFTKDGSVNYLADARMLTRFINNKVIADAATLATQSGTGVTQVSGGVAKTNETINGTYWINDQTGYGVASNGVIIKYTDGGNTLEYQSSGVTNDLKKVVFTTTTTGYVVGNQGILLKTTNGGSAWSKIDVDALTIPAPTVNSFNFTDVAFVGTQTGYLTSTSGYVIKTTDAFATATVDNPIQQTAALNSVSMISDKNGVMVGDVRTILIRSSNAPTYTTQVSPVNPNLNAVHFVSSTRGYAVGNAGTIIRTVNGGTDWTVLNSGISSDLLSVQFLTATKGFVTTLSGAVWMTNDGGDTWTNASGTASNSSLYDINFVSNSVGFAVGAKGTLIKTIDGGTTWTNVGPVSASVSDINRIHQGGTNLPENGVGLGGAIYFLDKVSTERIGRADSVQFNRVRMQNNSAYTGSAVYSDNYDMKLIFNRSLITGNTATSPVGVAQNTIKGPVVRNASGVITENTASSDLVPTTIYGEVQGPLPAYIFSDAANSIYNNNAKFLIRLPDAPNTKGALGGTGIGLGGTDTLRGNYWGLTEANINVEVQHNVGGTFGFTTQETFFVESNGSTVMAFISSSSYTDLRNQGPFESLGSYVYKAIPLTNGIDENTVGANSIPEKLVFSGKIYDIYDKGTDIKTADYSKRRMSPIEDFSVGIPTGLRLFTNPLLPSSNKYVRRFVRDPYVAEAKDKNGALMFPWISSIQAEWKSDDSGLNYHPIGYPLWLEAKVNYDGISEVSNNDPNLLNESVFFVINNTTGDFIRVNLRQVSEDAPFRETFRARVELVPDQSARDANTFIRRTAEGMANFGTQGALLNALRRNASNEDKATLQGRKYDGTKSDFGSDPNILSNNSPIPSISGKVTYFAGERYRALPVNVGDKIQVVSRSVLWNDNVLTADNGSMNFTITNTTMPPAFTGNMVSLVKDTIVKIVPSELPARRALGIPDTIRMVELLRRIALTEDRDYPKSKGTYSATTTPVDAGRGRDSIMTITAKDTNKFYDPRALLNPDKFTQLTYTWTVDASSGLNNWLGADTIVSSNKTNQNPRDLALGYIKLKGRAVNPYVVPGGENVTVTAANYPPNYRTIYSLKAAKAAGLVNISDDEISKFINLYSTYLNAPAYDNINARYLQQDTVDVGRNFLTTENFKINVVDSIPSILDENTTSSTISKPGYPNEILAEYMPTIYTCDKTQDNRLKANLTDKLRFQMDLNTDDELEDLAAEKYKGWSFPYGRTAYGFLNLTNQGGLIDVDTTYVWNDLTKKYDAIYNQSKPFWMTSGNLMRYGTDNTVDNFSQDFTTNGQLNIRIPKAAAIQYLTPLNAYNGALNTDTSFVIVINDGHSGLTRKKFDLLINFQPQITTTSLPAAKEDNDYNPQLLDSSRMIKVVDPNFGQKRKYELIYSSYSSNTISKDPCYAEAGVWDVSSLKVTPNWLKINPDNGLLYGKPGIKDAPSNEKVVVLVTDAEGLNDLKVLDLRVDSTHHYPSLSAAPTVSCIDLKTTYTDSLTVIDLDLERDPLKATNPETLTLSVVLPTSGLAIEPATIKGPSTKKIKVAIKSLAGFNPPRDNDGKITIKVKVSDGVSEDILTYRLKISDDTKFVSKLTVKNSEGGKQILEWGTAEKNVTTGDATDNFAIGRLDSNYCEYELPPYPTTDIFDARWTIPTINGTLRNVYPSNVNKNQIYIAQIQPGDVQGSGSKVYPIKINWDLTSVPANTDATKNPTKATWYLRDALSNGSLFNINMNTGDARYVNGFIGTKSGNNYELQINNTSTKAFVIFQDWNSDVAELDNFTLGNKINTVSPNPVSNEANINFEVSSSNIVKIEIVDILGNNVATIVNGQYAPGKYNVQWFDADKLSTGSYIVKMTTGVNTDSFPVNVVK